MITARINKCYLCFLLFLSVFSFKKASSQVYKEFCINYCKLTKDVSDIAPRYYDHNKRNYIVLDIGRRVIIIYQIYTKDVVVLEKKRGLCYEDYPSKKDDYTLVLQPLYGPSQTLIEYIAVEKGIPKANFSERNYSDTKLEYNYRKLKEIDYRCRFLSTTPIVCLSYNLYFIQGLSGAPEILINY